MTIETLNILAIISLILQTMHLSCKTTTLNWLGFLGFIFYPIVILTLNTIYNKCSLAEKKIYIKNSIIYSITLLIINSILLFTKKEFNYTNIIDNNLFLSFLIFIAIKKLFMSLKSSRLSTKCNSFFILIIIVSLYLSVGNNMLYLCLFAIFHKFDDNILLRNLCIILLSITNPILTGNFYSMGILLSIVFLSELKPYKLKTNITYKTYIKLLLIAIMVSNITKILI